MPYSVSQSMRFFDCPLPQTEPRGFLKDFLLRQKKGLSGHYAAQGYPFNTCLWEGKIQAAFRELDYNGMPRPVPGPNQWWPYEQTGYLLDGLLRLGLLLQDDECLAVFRRNLDWLLSHPSPEGRLAGAAYGYASEWPMAVFYKGVSAYLRAYSDEKALEAFHRHYAALPLEELADGSRNIANIEGLVEVSALTKDGSLLQKALDGYEYFNAHEEGRSPYMALTLEKLESLPNIVFHGVTLCEEIKLPVLLYLAAGERRLLDAAVHGWKKVMGMHGQIPGVPCAVEHAFGRDPNQGYETCVISDSLYSLGFFLMATCDASYADEMEKIAFNALPGAVTKDFSALQYFSAPNQVNATPFSLSSSFLRGCAPLRQYRPDHFAACCPGNVHRALPNYISRMWLTDGEGAPVAALYGASAFRGKWRGTSWRIEQQTEYPFGEEISFCFDLKEELRDMPFTFRVPAWCGKASFSLNGGFRESLEDVAGKFVTIRRSWQRGDVLHLHLPMSVEQKYDRQWSWFESGPLVYSLPISHTVVRENPDDRFTPLTVNPAASWAFAVPPDAAVKKNHSQSQGYPLENPPCSLRVECRRVTGAFAELEQQRYTPALPLDCRLGQPESILLKPMGTTLTRMTAFPDGRPRRFLPILSGYTLENPDSDPAGWEEDLFRQKAREIRIDPSGYFDLARFYHHSQNCEAYLQIRFWAEWEEDATLALMMSDGGAGYFQGRKILEIPPIMEAEYMEPLWFPIHVHRGHNHLLLKVVDTVPTYDHRDAWGAMARFFVTGNE